MTNRFMDKNGRGSVDIFRRKNFVSQCRNISQRNPSVLCFRKILIGDKFMDKRVGRSAKMFRRKFCLTVQKFFVGEPFRMSLISGIEKFYAYEGYVTTFRRFFLSHSAEKTRRGTL